MSKCMHCETELVKLSEDTNYCPNQQCQGFGVNTALAKNDENQVIEIRTGELK